MKVTIKGFLFHRKCSWEKNVTYEFSNLECWADADRALIGPHSFEVDIPDNFDPNPVKIAALRKEKQRIQAEAHVKAENIEAQIQELLCIEDKSVRCPECKSENCHPAHGFTTCGLETSYKSCDDCGHQWGHE